MITEEAAALFSYLAYSPFDANLVALQSIWQELPAYRSFDDDTSGFAVRVYQNQVTSEVVVAFRGSAPLTPSEPDWFPTNIALALGVGAV